MRMVQQFLKCCKLAEMSSGQGNADYVEEFDRVIDRGWSHVVDVEKVKPCLQNHKHWAVVMSVAIPGEQYRFVDSLVSLAASHGLSKFICEHSRRTSAFTQTDVSPELRAVLNIPRKRSLAHAEDSCEVVESLVLNGADINYKKKRTHSAWEIAISDFNQMIEIRDGDLFPDWQFTLCKMLLCLFKKGGDPMLGYRAMSVAPARDYYWLTNGLHSVSPRRRCEAFYPVVFLVYSNC